MEKKDLKDYIIVALLVLASLAYLAFIVLRLVYGEWVWRPLGYISISIYALYITMQIFEKERKRIEFIIFKMLLAFNSTKLL